MQDRRQLACCAGSANATAARVKPILSRSVGPHLRRGLSARMRVGMIAAALGPATRV